MSDTAPADAPRPRSISAKLTPSSRSAASLGHDGCCGSPIASSTGPAYRASSAAGAIPASEGDSSTGHRAARPGWTETERPRTK